jgi:hypothetical protein
MTARVSAAFVPTTKSFGMRAMISLKASDSEAVAVKASDNDFDDFSSKVREQGIRFLFTVLKEL